MAQKEKTLKNELLNFIIAYKTFAIVLLLAIILGISTNTFLTSKNLFNLLRQITVNTIVASGFTLIIGALQIDLSIGRCLAFVGVVMAKLMVAGCPIPVAIFTAMIIGTGCGMVSGAVVTKFKLPPFVVTLAMQSVFRGVTYLITNMKPVSNLPAAFIFLGQGYIGAVPVNIIIMIITVTIIYIIVNKTRIGRYAVAMGGNAEATRVCGISIMKTQLFVYAIGGFCAAIGSVVLTARTASAQIAAGDNIVFDSIASVVIGGTSMYGGNANVIGTVFGCMIVGIVNNGLNLLSVNANWQIVAKGVMIMLAVLIDNLTTEYYERRARKQVLAG